MSIWCNLLIFKYIYKFHYSPSPVPNYTISENTSTNQRNGNLIVANKQINFIQEGKEELVELIIEKNGSGQITGDDIDCGDICTAQYVKDTYVVLTAVPSAGFTFTGWEGACSGISNCKLTMDQIKNVTAKFKINPTARLNVFPTKGIVPLKISLEGNNSTDEDGKIIEYIWESSNGQQVVGASTEIKFNHAGTYNIVLTVTDNDGLTDSVEQTVIVEKNKLPISAFTVSPKNGIAPLTVNLDASASNDPDGELESYEWISSDGHKNVGKTTDMTFDKEGQFEITLTVTDNGNSTTTATQNISVGENSLPIPQFILTPETGKEPLSVVVDARSSYDSDGHIADYQWETSDGQTAFDDTANFTFDTAGEYEITLTVADDKDSTDNLTKIVTVTTNTCSRDTSQEEWTCIEFQNLQPSYNISDHIQIDVNIDVKVKRFDRVDLWIAVEFPNGSLLFKTDLLSNSFVLNPQPFKNSLEIFQINHHLVDLELTPGLGSGIFTFYALYVNEGTNPLEEDISIIKRSEFIIEQTILANE
ncbi:MAG: PKD domain-containing protein [Candidatus Marithrix sp.]